MTRGTCCPSRLRAAARWRRCFVTSNVVLNFLVFTLIIALAAQGWNLLGGYGGQYLLRARGLLRHRRLR
jgi:ABC-type branched-subunit amino acid transport system permease subunit